MFEGELGKGQMRKKKQVRSQELTVKHMISWSTYGQKGLKPFHPIVL